MGAIVTKRLAAGAFAYTVQTLYTAPVGATTIVKSLTLCNTGDANCGVTLLLAGTPILHEYILEAHDTLTVPVIDQVIHSGETITGDCDIDASISFYISGKEIF